MRLWLWIGLFSLLGARPLGAETLVFETSLDTQSEMSRGISDAFKTILEKHEVKLEVREYPSRRGLQELKTGRVDGSMARIGNLTSLYGIDNVVRIEMPVYTLSAFFWCRKDAAEHKTIKVGYRLGNILATKIMHAVDIKRVEVEALTSYRSVVEMLKSGRLSCILSNPELLAADGLDLASLETFDKKEVLTTRAFAWIAKKHEKYRGILEAGLKTYPFPKGYREKYNIQKAACQGEYDVLCPDGVVFTKKVDFRTNINTQTLEN